MSSRPLPNENTIRILITTDNHVGYNENDAITGDDSWKTFREILQIAQQQSVDMVLQGGDLFHINKPSKKSLLNVMKNLRLYCLGDKPCELQLLSDPSTIFDDEFNTVNYEDGNLNVGIPVFAISGNHDDASGDALVSPMDILHASGLVNHFGKVLTNDEITVRPLLFQKGSTKLALYGMASVRDERLFRTFREGKVKFQTPNVAQNEWFNLMVVHQNHHAHSNTAYLPENFLPSFLDFVVWGHEHECIPHAQANPTQDFDVLQPGSSVATSLCEGEAVEKCVFVLEVTGRHYTLEAIPLATVRPFVMKELVLSETTLKPTNKTEILKFLHESVEELIQEADEQWREKNPGSAAEPPLPLVRLRVEYSGHPTDYQVENPRRFSNRFVGRVANSNSVVQFHKKKRNQVVAAKKDMQLDEDMGEELQVQHLVSTLLSRTELSLLPELGMNEAIRLFVEKEDKGALKKFIDNEIVHEVEVLSKEAQFIDTENFDDLKSYMKKVKKERSSRTSTRVESDPSRVYSDPPSPIGSVSKASGIGAAESTRVESDAPSFAVAESIRLATEECNMLVDRSNVMGESTRIKAPESPKFTTIISDDEPVMSEPEVRSEPEMIVSEPEEIVPVKKTTRRAPKAVANSKSTAKPRARKSKEIISDSEDSDNSIIEIISSEDEKPKRKPRARAKPRGQSSILDSLMSQRR